MKIKILTPNQEGNFVFTKNEIEKLLNEAYEEGYRDGKQSNSLIYSSGVRLLDNNCIDCLDTNLTKEITWENKLHGEVINND